MRIVFFGSDDFARVCLNHLLASPDQVVGIVTGPDQRQGRGLKLTVSTIKQVALERQLPYEQPLNLREPSFMERLKGFDADLFVVVAYGKILPQQVLDIPKLFCINVHGSLLPFYRGPAPVNWAILNGESQTGVTIQKMVLALDSGDVLDQQIMLIGHQETASQLRMRMAELGAMLLCKSIAQIRAGQYSFKSQDEKQATYAPKLTKDMGRIQWDKPAKSIDCLIRGLQPWPGAFCSFKGKSLKILEAVLVQSQGATGTIIEISRDGFTVACGQDALLVKKVHLESGKAILAHDFILGHHLSKGDRLI